MTCFRLYIYMCVTDRPIYIVLPVHDTPMPFIHSLFVVDLGKILGGLNKLVECTASGLPYILAY